MKQRGRINKTHGGKQLIIKKRKKKREKKSHPGNSFTHKSHGGKVPGTYHRVVKTCVWPSIGT